MPSDQPIPSASSSSSPSEPQSNGSVPSPTTSFPTYLPHVSSILDRATTHAADLPGKSDLSFHRTMDRPFAKSLDETSNSVLKIAERLLELAVNAGKGSDQHVKDKGKSFKSSSSSKISRRRKLEDEDDVIDGFRGSVVDVVDGLLEDADSNLDEVNGAKKKAAINVKASLAAAAGAKLPGPFGKDRLEANLILDRSMVKPQLFFSPPIDNSASRPPWRPTLITKAHAMVPLEYPIPDEVEISFSDEEDEVTDTSEKAEKRRSARKERELKARSHPYFYETKHLPYPTSLFTQAPPIRPKDFEETPFDFVDTPEQLEVLIKELKESKEIAVDLEHHNMRSYEGFTCLMQISNRRADWVVDTLKLRKELRDGKLGGVMADPSIVKVFHGADSDIIWLQQDFDIYVVNLFDTYHACKVLDFPKLSLASLLQLYCDFETDKRYQMADWRIRPLPTQMLFYARSDTHFLLFIFDNLRNALLAKSSRNPSPAIETDPNSTSTIPTPRRNPQQAMRSTLKRSAQTALKLYERDEYDAVTGKGALGWASMSKKLGKKDVLDSQIGWAFKRLHLWRDGVAREEDESPHYVLPNHVLILLAQRRPKSVGEASAAIGKMSECAARRIEEIVSVIRTACSDFDALETAVVPAGSNINSSVPTIVDHGPRIIVPLVISGSPAVNRQNMYNTWAALQSNSGASQGSPRGTAPAKKSTSALFGATISRQSGRGPSPPLAVGSGGTSQLFGNALGGGRGKPGSKRMRARMMSPTFEALQQSIYQELAHPPPVAVPSTTKQVEDKHKPEPETVPFVPRPKVTSTNVVVPVETVSKDTDTGSGPPVKMEKMAKPSLPADKDGIVQVKKSNRQKKKEKLAALEVPKIQVASMSPTSSSAPAAGTLIPPPMKKHKIKVKPKDIPVFDYSAEPNILDQPGSAGSGSRMNGKAISRAEKKKQRKEKELNKKPVIDTSDFKRPPTDMTQPKAGNKSGTFKK